MSTGITIFPNIFPSGIDPYIAVQNWVDDVFAEDVNSLQRSVVAIETYLIPPSGLGNTFVFRSGDSMYGDLFMSGSSAIITSNIQENSPGSSVNIEGHILPSQSGTYDLGSPTFAFRAIYADDMIDTSGSSTFVKRAGDDMYGDLTMSGNTAIYVNNINDNGSDISITSNNSVITYANSYLEASTTGTGFTSSLILGSEANLTSERVYLYSSSGTNLDLNGINASLVANDVDSQISITAGYAVNIGNGLGNLSIQSGQSYLHHNNNTNIQAGNNVNLLSQDNRINISTSGLELRSSSFYGTPIDILGKNSSGINILSSNGPVFIGATSDIGTSGNIIPRMSGTDDLGSSDFPFRTIYADDIIDTSGSSTFVKRAGDDMYGDLFMSGSTTILTQFISENAPGSGINIEGSIIPTQSGTYDLGSSDMPFRTLYADDMIDTSGNSTFVKRAGDNMFGPLTMTDSDVVLSGTSSITGLSNVGVLSPTYIEVGDSTANNSYLNIDQTSGEFTLHTSGTDSIYGQLGVITTTSPIIRNIGDVEVSGTIVPWDSGAFDLGSTGLHWRTIYVDNIVSSGGAGEYVNVTGDTMTGALTMSGTSAINVQNIVHNGVGNGIYIDAASTDKSVQIYSGREVLIQPSGVGFGITLEALNGPITLRAMDNESLGSSRDVQIQNFTDGDIIISAETASGNIYLSTNTNSIDIDETLNRINLESSDGYIRTKGDIIPSSDDFYNLGSTGSHFAQVYAGTGNFHAISGLSPIDVLSNLSLYADIIPSGAHDLGSITNPFETIYVNSIVSSGGAGEYVNVTGDTMTGPLVMSGNIIIGAGSLVSGISDVTLIANDAALQAKGYNSANSILYPTLTIGQFGGLTLGGYDPITYGSFTRAEILDASFDLRGFDPSFGTYSRLNIIDSSFQANGYTSGYGQYPRLTIIDSSFQTSGYIPGYGQLTRLAIDDSSFQTTGYISGYGQVARLNIGDSSFETKGYISGYGQLTRLIINDSSLEANGYVSGYGQLTRMHLGDDQFYVNSYVSGNIGSTTFPRISANDSYFQVNGQEQGSQHNLAIIDNSYTNIYGYNVANTGTYARMNLFDTYLIINGYDSSDNSTHDLLNIQDSNFTIKDYISGVGQFTIIDGNRTLTTIHSTGLKVDGDILANTANTQNIGSPGTPFSGIYATTINGETAVVAKINEKPSGSTDGVNDTFTLAFSPFPESTQLFNNGIYMIVSGTDYATDFDYSVSANVLTFVDAPASGSKLVINYNYIPV